MSGKQGRTCLIAVILLALGIGLWAVARPAAGQRADTQVTREQPAEIEDISAGFRSVANVVRPSVVSIRVKKYQVKGSTEDIEGPEPSQDQQDMEEFQERLRRFFGPNDPFGHPDFGDQLRRRRTQPQRPSVGIGSGVIVDAANGYILTNHHVVREADEIQVKLHNGYRYAAEKIGHDGRADLAIIKIDADDLQEATLGSSEEAKTGDIVLAVGSPWGLEQTVTQGIVSAKNRSIGSLLGSGVSDADYIQTDAAVNPGNSGGPLVNVRGQVIGINVAIRPQSGLVAAYAGVVFAIPIDHAKKVMEHIISGEPLKRGWLGMSFSNLDDDSALGKSLGIEHRPGVVVRGLWADQPARKAGMKENDVILEVDGETVVDGAVIQRAVASKTPGSTINLTILRDKKILTLKVKLGEQPSSEELLAMRREGPAGSGIEKMGLDVRELTAEQAKKIGVPEDTKGLLVRRVRPGGLAAQLGIRPNDVITKIQGQPVQTVEQFNDTLDRRPLSESISITAINKSGTKSLSLRMGR